MLCISILVLFVILIAFPNHFSIALAAVTAGLYFASSGFQIRPRRESEAVQQRREAGGPEQAPRQGQVLLRQRPDRAVSFRGLRLVSKSKMLNDKMSNDKMSNNKMSNDKMSNDEMSCKTKF
jgi:hypothetical protein